MKSTLPIILLSLVFSGSALANPTFEYKFQKFPTKEKYKGTPAKPIIKTQGDRLFRTRLREAAAKGPDFAGHFKVATWGCGSDGCTSFRIIDSNTGEILPVGGTVSRSCRQDNDEDILVYQPNSRLFIINGNLDDERLGVFYYEFKNKKLILLKEAQHPRKDVNCFQPES